MISRAIAIIVELLVLIAVIGSLLMMVRLTVLDAGLRSKYKRAIGMGLLAIGAVVVTFFIVHLTLFYPTEFGVPQLSDRVVFWAGQETFIRSVF